MHGWIQAETYEGTRGSKVVAAKLIRSFCSKTHSYQWADVRIDTGTSVATEVDDVSGVPQSVWLCGAV